MSAAIYSVQDESKTPEKFKTYSPGVVLNDEELLRTDFDPENMKDGQLAPTAVNLEDLDSRGFSVDRTKHVKIEYIEQRLKAQQEEKSEKRQEAYIGTLSCQELRDSLDPNGQRNFIIIDSAIEENRAHAHIQSAIKRTPGERRKLRSILIPMLERNLTTFKKFLEQRYSKVI